MLSPDEDTETVPQTKSSRLKRKASMVVDSDEEVEEVQSIDAKAYKKGLSAYRPSPPPANSNGRAKKLRVSSTEVESENEEEDGRPSFAGKLNKFKKSPVKKSRKSKSSDDDDFIVPDDEIELPSDDDDDRPTRARSTSRSSGRFSRASSSHSHPDTTDADDDIDDDDDEPSSKSKKVPSRPALKKNNGASASGGRGGGGGSNSFVTKAEMRAMATKDEKKSQENPFGFLLDPMDKDQVHPGQKGYDPRTLYIPKSVWKEFSPFETQFWEIKQNHYDTVLFFQKGKFLELYEEDARIGHREFDLKLTQRVKMSMVGVPEMSFNFWAAKFLAKGYKVGRVDQVETALGAEMRLASDKSKGKKTAGEKIVRRELNKVYTNGTLVDEELLTDEQAGHCVSIRESDPDDFPGASTGSAGGGGAFGICVLDSATSEFNLCAFEDDVCRTRLETLMRQLRVKEIVFTKGNLSVETTRLLKSLLPATCLWTSLRDKKEGFDYETTIEELKQLYPPSEAGSDSQTQNEESMIEDEAMEGMEGVPKAIRDMLKCKSAVESLGSMIWYLRQLNIDKDILTMRNFNVYDPMKRGQGLVLDGQTLAHIEVLVNNEGTEEGSLLELLGRCVTPFGKRLFRIWLCMPLREIKDINARLDAIEDLMRDLSFEEQFVKVAKGLPDLERIVSRIHAKNCKVKDFLKVLSAFRRLSEGLAELADASESFNSKTILGLLRSAPDLEPHIKNVQSKFKRPDKDNTDELIPVEGKDEAYDEISAEIKELEDELEKELKKLKKQLGCDLTYWHSAQGTKEIYLVQTKAGQEDIPRNWVKSGATKAATRWVVPSLSATIRSLKEARETRNATIKSYKLRLFEEFDKDRGVWLRAIRVLAELDCLFSLAKSSQAMGEPVCRPEFVETDGEAWVDFVELRHPALAVRTKGDFIPNDVKLGGEVGRIALLTGELIFGGKSTVMRMTATGVIMAQLGMYVPAQKARLSPVDSILTRMGAYDNMFSNASTFKVELDECCKILRDATPRSLVILDELGRGTSTYDGMAIAGAVLHQLATHTLALTFFATHYGSLTDDFAYHPNIRNMHMETMVNEEKRELVFLYKLIDGIASSSFGTHVANLAGVPLEVVQRAEVVSKDFARQFKEKVDGKRKKSATGRLPLVAQANFAFLYGLVTGAKAMDENPVRQREVLRRMKVEVLKCLEE
ncbi:DNA mismatch repair protein Msh6 [Stereum hirsutum FP-91666 SS1]|uniref:DNA mismatch repair protein Msh6 n=1 Tax=Stereum hirsutum (strain FP-91666) TaxID=721885 RepID=UPI000440FC38|nr:DNA mismatch repair protein Msh6 [Stereum hirsutum FP-91666 SS1]EIM88849.1 DNA mismatch repair protein Msh6 [Stereum hirsutum FP-91666 SS1]